MHYKDKIRRKPLSTCSNLLADKTPTKSSRTLSSSVNNCEILMTESLGKLLCRVVSKTFPSELASFRLVEIMATTTVFIWLRLNLSDWIIRTGRGKPGPEPVGSGRFAHQIRLFRLPFFLRQRKCRHFHNHGVNLRFFLAVKFVQPCCYFVFVIFLAQFFHAHCKNFTARYFQFFRQSFAQLKDIVRN